MAGCAIMERQTVYMLKHTGLWGEAVRQRKPVVTNPKEGSPIQENLSKILRSGNRARKLVQQIQTYSRAAAPRKTTVRIATLVEEVVEQLRGVAAPGVVIKTTLDRSTFVDAEPTQIHEVFLNLGMNALQAIGEAGQLSIR